MTTATLPPLSDDDFLKQFEDHSLPPEYFSHLGHLRLAWLYVTKHDLDTAISKTCDGIKSYAESLGAHDKFNYTMTHAFVKIMHQRMLDQGDHGWSEFLNRNQDLVNTAVEVLLQYFREETLFSENARKQLVSADLMPF